MKNGISDRDLKEIIAKAKGGDREAFSHLYTAYFTPVYRYLYFRVHSREEAEDLAQEVFLKAYKGFGNYTYSGLDPLAYFYTIAKNTLIDRSRKKKIKLVDEDNTSDVPDPGMTRDKELMRDDEAQELHANIAKLPHDQREVIMLRFIQELSTKEVAALMGKKEEAVRKLQSRGLHSLRTIFKNNGELQ